MATNRADTLDPALLRPGRLDRKIEFPVPDRRQKRMVFTACTAKMNLSEVRESNVRQWQCHACQLSDLAVALLLHIFVSTGERDFCVAGGR